MSSISNVSGFNISQLGRSFGTGKAGRPPEPPKELREQLESKISAAGKELGIDTSKFAEIGGKIQDALGKVDLSGSDDPQAAIESTINSTLKDNGIDPEQFKADFEKVADKAGLPKPGQFPGGGFGGPQGAGGFGGGGFNVQSSQQKQLSELLQSLTKGDADSDESSSTARLASFFSSAPAGSFLDAVA